MSAALGSWWPPKWVPADWVLRAAWWISGDRVTVGTRCDEFHDPGTALLLLYRAPVVENTLLNTVARSGCFATQRLENTLNSSPRPTTPGGTQQTFKREASDVQPLTLLYTILTKNVSLFGTYRYPSHVLSLNTSGSRFGSFHKR